MGYTHGRKWTEEEIENRIIEIIDKMELKTFPTRSEIESYYHSTSLSNKITKTGGFEYWSKKVGIKQKYCESQLGKTWEMNCLSRLKKLGYSVDKMSTKYPYDLMANKNIKVDVKAGYLYKNNGNSPFYTFNLEKKFPTCDIYVCYCLDEYKNVERIYIIPSCILSGKCQLSIGVHSSIYDNFLDRWDFFETYNNFYKMLEDKN